ncbi:5786_t:CDS:1, partial [Paraglomus occultum]
IEYNKPEQETESSMVNDEQSMKEIEYNKPGPETESSVINDEQI